MSDYECSCPEQAFTDLFDDLDPALRKAIPQTGLPCYGTGATASYCSRCPFGQQKYTPEWFDSAYIDEDELQFGNYS